MSGLKINLKATVHSETPRIKPRRLCRPVVRIWRGYLGSHRFEPLHLKNVMNTDEKTVKKQSHYL